MLIGITPLDQGEIRVVAVYTSGDPEWGLAGPLRKFSIFDIFAPTQENPRTRTSSSTSTIELQNDWEEGETSDRAPDFPRNLFLVPRLRSSIVIVLELVLVLDLCCCRQGREFTTN